MITIISNQLLTFNRGGAPNSFNKADTATGSVAANILPNVILRSNDH